jgi:hypothetical protein
MADETVASPLAGFDWKSVATQVLGVLKASVAGYLKDHADTEKLLIKWSEEIAKLMVKRIFANPADKAADEALIAIYKKAMKEELDAVTIDAEGLTHSTLSAVLDAAWHILLTALPVIIKLAIP